MRKLDSETARFHEGRWMIHGIGKRELEGFDNETACFHER